jgi:hypothetical protein
MILGDHRQETEKKSKKEHTRLDWDINTGHCTVYTLAGWIGTSTRPRTLYTQTTIGKTKRNCSSTQQTTLKQLSRTTLAETTADTKTKGRAAPHRKDRRHAGPNATELLQPNRPPDDVKITEAPHSCVRGDHQPKGPPPCGTQRHRAVATKPTTRRHEDHRNRSHPLLRARGPPTRHSARLSRARGPPNPPHGSRSGLVSRIAVEEARTDALPPGAATSRRPPS